MKNLQGRSTILDVHAIDSTGKEFDVEIQRKDAGAKRARHNSSLLDAHILKSGVDTEDIPDSYVIFITENDVMKGNQPIYPVERYVTIGENKVLFGDGSHILYVNGKYRGNDEIGKLMHDFLCTNPDDMNYEALAKKARYFKQDEKGVAAMCKIMEDMRNEAALNNARETAERLIKKRKMTLEEIAECVPLLSIDEPIIVNVTGTWKRFFNIKPTVSGPAVDPPARMVKLIPVPTVTAPNTADNGKFNEKLDKGAVKKRKTGKIAVGITVLTINPRPSSNQPPSITMILIKKLETKSGIPVRL